MKRLGVFAFYNKNGIVGDYVSFLLKSMKYYCVKIITVCNGNLSENGRQTLSAYSEEIYERENKDFDAGAFKYFFTSVIKREEIEEYDEVLCFNDTFYGPFFSMDDIFLKMGESNCDFWGLTANNGQDDINGHIPYHVQSYFLNFKSTIIHSNTFYEYWESLESDFSDVTDCIYKYELKLTSFFSDRGFIADSYVHSDFEDNLYIFFPYELIVRKKCPILKKKTFLIPDNGKMQGSRMRALEYINKNYGCAEMIYKDLLANNSILTLRKNLGLSYIIDNMNLDEGIEEKLPVIYSFLPDDSLINMLPSSCLFIAMKDFDRKTIEDQQSMVCILGNESLKNNYIKIRNILDNLLFDDNYIKKVRSIFDENKQIGCILPESILDREDIIDREKSLFVSDGCLYLRTELVMNMIQSGVSLNSLSMMSGDELSVMIQKFGYYTYSVSNELYSTMKSEFYKGILDELLFHLEKNYEFSSVEDLVGKLVKDRLHLKRIKKMVREKL